MTQNEDVRSTKDLMDNLEKMNSAVRKINNVVNTHPSINRREYMSTNREILNDEIVAVETLDGTIIYGRILSLHRDRAGYFEVDWDPNYNTLLELWEDKRSYLGVSESDAVYEVKIKNSSQTYSFPQSAVYNKVKYIPFLNNYNRYTDIISEGTSYITTLAIENEGRIVESKYDINQGTLGYIQESIGMPSDYGTDLETLLNVMEHKDDNTEGVRDEDDIGNIECSLCSDEFPENDSGMVEGDEGEPYCSLECLLNAY